MAGSRSASASGRSESGFVSSGRLFLPRPRAALAGSGPVTRTDTRTVCRSGAAGFPGTVEARRGVTTGESCTRSPQVVPQFGLPAWIFSRSLTGAPPNYRPEREGPRVSALCIVLIGTFQNLRHLLTGASTGPSTCHFRFLLLEPSRKIPPNGWLVPLGTAAVAMAAGQPFRRYWLKLAKLTRLRPARPSLRLFAVLIKRATKNDSKNRNLRYLLVGDGI